MNDREERYIGVVIGCAVIFTLLLLLFTAVYYAIYYAYADTVVGTVVEKQVDEGNLYVVIETSSGKLEVLSNNDNLLYGKMNSREVIAKIEVGEVYTFKVNGWRFPLLSDHKNILKATKVN